MQRPASSVLPVVRAEFDLAPFIAGSTFDGVQNLQSIHVNPMSGVSASGRVRGCHVRQT
jgi:hypothetical protein